MFEHFEYFAGWMCVIAGLYSLIGGFVQIYIKGGDYRGIDIIYNCLFTIGISWGLMTIHYC